jgi:hypothetical protein
VASSPIIPIESNGICEASSCSCYASVYSGSVTRGRTWLHGASAWLSLPFTFRLSIFPNRSPTHVHAEVNPLHSWLLLVTTIQLIVATGHIATCLAKVVHAFVTLADEPGGAERFLSDFTGTLHAAEQGLYTVNVRIFSALGVYSGT